MTICGHILQETITISYTFCCQYLSSILSIWHFLGGTSNDMVGSGSGNGGLQMTGTSNGSGNGSQGSCFIMICNR